MSSGLMLCDECDKRTTCRTLCPQAEQYVNQDYVASTEPTFTELGTDVGYFTEDFTSYIPSTRVRILSCKRCGHTWTPRIHNVLMCPKCKNTK